LVELGALGGLLLLGELSSARDDIIDEVIGLPPYPWVTTGVLVGGGLARVEIRRSMIECD